MGIDFVDFGFAMLLITWGAPLAGGIPVLIGWLRTSSQWNSTGQRTFPMALSALTASIFIGPVGLVVLETINSSGDESLRRLFAIFLLVAFALSLAAMVIAARQRNSARAAVLTGSITVAAVNVLGFAWLFSTPRGISMWTSW